MNWTYSIRNKFSASLALLALCLLVLLSNYLDRVHTQNVKNSMATLYEDRLIADDYILKMTSTVYEIREVLGSDLSPVSKSSAVAKLMNDFKESYADYIKTKLTTEENSTAVELLATFKSLEQKLNKSESVSSGETEKALFCLKRLSNVQLQESSVIMKKAESEYAATKVSSQFAFAIIIIILVVLQAIVFSAKTVLPEKKPKSAALN